MRKSGEEVSVLAAESAGQIAQELLARIVAIILATEILGQLADRRFGDGISRLQQSPLVTGDFDLRNPPEIAWQSAGHDL